MAPIASERQSSVGMGGDGMSALILLVTFIMISAAGVDATLRVDYHNKCCPNVEKIVYREMHEAYQKDRTVAPGVLRVHALPRLLRSGKLVLNTHARDSNPFFD